MKGQIKVFNTCWIPGSAFQKHGEHVNSKCNQGPSLSPVCSSVMLQMGQIENELILQLGFKIGYFWTKKEVRRSATYQLNKTVLLHSLFKLHQLSEEYNIQNLRCLTQCLYKNTHFFYLRGWTLTLSNHWCRCWYVFAYIFSMGHQTAQSNYTPPTNIIFTNIIHTKYMSVVQFWVAVNGPWVCFCCSDPPVGDTPLAYLSDSCTSVDREAREHHKTIHEKCHPTLIS